MRQDNALDALVDRIEFEVEHVILTAAGGADSASGEQVSAAEALALGGVAGGHMGLL